MRKQILALTAIAFSACATDHTPLDPRPSLTAYEGPTVQISIHAYSMGPNSEIYTSDPSCFSTYQTSKTLPSIIINATTPNYNVDVPITDYANTNSGEVCFTQTLYTSGSVGVNVLGENGWEFVTSGYANAGGLLTVEVPQGSRVQLVAVPNYGSTFNTYSNSNFVSNGFGSYVYEADATAILGSPVTLNFVSGS